MTPDQAINTLLRLLELFPILIVIAIIGKLIATLIKWLIIQTISDSGLEHSFITFLIILFVPFGFTIELIRETLTNHNNRLIKNQREIAQFLADRREP